jgi:NAD(P)-dependent dehydrogenase (short-subunit alcohol dehydrogenase family)
MRVLVTGSTQGIGKALATAFVKNGDEVIVHCSKDLQKAERIRTEIGAKSAVVCNLFNMDEVNALYEKTGAVDCLILNASVQYKELWQDITDETFDKQFDINVKSTLKLMQAYYPAMQEKGFGRIVTIGSVNQYHQHSELSVYSATKCAVMKLVEVIAKQVAPFGVTVNNVAPGAIATPRNESVYNDEEKRKAVESVIPMGRFGKPEEIVGAVLMLCSEQGAYITGTDIVIDGGMRL